MFPLYLVCPDVAKRYGSSFGFWEMPPTIVEALGSWKIVPTVPEPLEALLGPKLDRDLVVCLTYHAWPPVKNLCSKSTPVHLLEGCTGRMGGGRMHPRSQAGRQAGRQALMHPQRAHTDTRAHTHTHTGTHCVLDTHAHKHTNTEEHTYTHKPKKLDCSQETQSTNLFWRSPLFYKAPPKTISAYKM